MKKNEEKLKKNEEKLKTNEKKLKKNEEKSLNNLKKIVPNVVFRNPFYWSKKPLCPGVWLISSLSCYLKKRSFGCSFIEKI